MQLSFRTTSAENDPPIIVTVTEATAREGVEQIENELDALTGERLTLRTDPAFDFDECVANLERGEKYVRRCFSTPEENYEISPSL